jgi:deoxyribonuclease IV
MKYIGAHVSTCGGVENAPGNAAEISADAFALFTKNQKKWFEPPLSQESIALFKMHCKALNFAPEYILPHGSYLVNIGSPEPDVLQISRNSLLEEMKRCESLNLKFLNIHLGAHKKLVSEDDCLKICAETINICLQNSENIILVLENSAGQGTRMGYRFEQLAQVITLIEQQQRVGICLDTCHAFGAGYDLTNLNKCEKVFAEFDSIVGYKWLKGMHLNDSKVELASRKDRHAPLGEGLIGLDCFRYVMQNKKFDNIPLILETPEPDKWADEIIMLKALAKEID